MAQTLPFHFPHGSANLHDAPGPGRWSAIAQGKAYRSYHHIYYVNRWVQVYIPSADFLPKWSWQSLLITSNHAVHYQSLSGISLSLTADISTFDRLVFVKQTQGILRTSDNIPPSALCCSNFFVHKMLKKNPRHYTGPYLRALRISRFSRFSSLSS